MYQSFTFNRSVYKIKAVKDLKNQKHQVHQLAVRSLWYFDSGRSSKVSYLANFFQRSSKQRPSKRTITYCYQE